MKSYGKILSAIFSAVLLGSACFGATITGTVKGPDGAAFQGAFVQAQNTQTRMTFMALSDSQGHYRVENVPAGDYRVGIRAPGFRADAQTGVKIAAGQDDLARFRAAKGRRALERYFHLPGQQALAGRTRQGQRFSTPALPATAFRRAWPPSRATPTAGRIAWPSCARR